MSGCVEILYSTTATMAPYVTPTGPWQRPTSPVPPSGTQGPLLHTVGPFPYGAGSGNVWLDNVTCTGQEPFLQSCSYTGFGGVGCPHSRDVGVACAGGWLCACACVYIHVDTCNPMVYIS